MKKRIFPILLLAAALCAVPAFAFDSPAPAQQEAAAAWEALQPPAGPVYVSEPWTQGPWRIGQVEPEYLDAGLQYVNFVRALAGLEPVTLSEHLSIQAQYGAVLLAANDELTHTPAKPAAMGDSFYRMGRQAAERSNLSLRYGYPWETLLQSAVQGHLDEKGEENRRTLGHRRWLLDPRLGAVGFGLASSASGKQYIVLPVSDRSGTGKTPAAVTWPGSGDFPNQVFSPETPFSVSLDPGQLTLPAEAELTATLTRWRDGAVFSVTGGTLPETLEGNAPYLLVNDPGYGLGTCVSFFFGTDAAGERWLGDYTVSLSGLRTRAGEPYELEYTVRFFDCTALSQPSAWAWESVAAAEESGLLPWALTDQYQLPLTRLEFCRLVMTLWRQGGGAEPETAEAPVFSDCDDPDVTAAAALGIVSGDGDGHFVPGRALRRQEAAVMLQRTARALGQTEPGSTLLPAYRDESAIQPYAREAVLWAAAVTAPDSGSPVMAGVGYGRFDPMGSYTREQALVTVLRLYRALDA